MLALVHAELLKLRSTRTPAGLLLATLALAVLTVTVSVPKAGASSGSLSLDDPDVMTVAVANGFGVPLVLVVLLGGIAFTQEFRYGTVTLTYLGEPRRARILLAKWLAAALTAVLVSVATLADSMPISAALIRSRGGEVTMGVEFWRMAAAATLVMVAYAVIGVAIGALVRNQITAIVAVLVWMLAVEQLVLQSFPAVGRWMPGGATNALLRLGPSIGLDPDQLLSVPVSGLLVVGYTVSAVALALRLAPRKDVL